MSVVVTFQRKPEKRPACSYCKGRRVVALDDGERITRVLCPCCNGRGPAPMPMRKAA